MATDPQCLLLVCPAALVERLLRTAAAGPVEGGTRAAAAHCLWQLASHCEYSAEVRGRVVAQVQFTDRLQVQNSVRHQGPM